MKIVLSIIIIILAVWAIFFWGKDKKNAPASQINMGETEEMSSDISGTFNISQEESVVAWTGSRKIIKNYFDHGRVAIKDGSVSINEGKITSGSIVFDMSTIAAESTGRGKDEDMLTKHLKSSDFFDVDNFPEAKYEVVGVEEVEGVYLLNGNLTVKGETHPLMVPVKTGVENGNVVLVGATEVDRTIWGVRYGSDKFFDNMGDNVINDIFVLEFKIVAR